MKKTIIEAIKEVMLEAGRPLSAVEAYRAIIIGVDEVAQLPVYNLALDNAIAEDYLV